MYIVSCLKEIKMKGGCILCFITDIIDYVVYGTVIQEVKTSNIAREVFPENICYRF